MLAAKRDGGRTSVCRMHTHDTQDRCARSAQYHHAHLGSHFKTTTPSLHPFSAGIDNTLLALEHKKLSIPANQKAEQSKRHLHVR